ncbi:hypothetical protein [Nereida sp. MMG025]|nr:hypothetical protein [Nereida sp. MMG025]
MTLSHINDGAPHIFGGVSNAVGILFLTDVRMQACRTNALEHPA